LLTTTARKGLGGKKEGKIQTEYMDPVPVYDATDDLRVQAQWLTSVGADRTTFQLLDNSWATDCTAFSMRYYIGIPDIDYDDVSKTYALCGGVHRLPPMMRQSNRSRRWRLLPVSLLDPQRNVEGILML